MPITTLGVWDIEDYSSVREQLREAAELALAAEKTDGYRVYKEHVPLQNQITIVRQWNSESAAEEFIALCNSLEVKPISYRIIASE